jgi:hypothetical protein
MTFHTMVTGPTSYYRQIKADEMGMACDTHGRDKKLYICTSLGLAVRPKPDLAQGLGLDQVGQIMFESGPSSNDWFNFRRKYS